MSKDLSRQLIARRKKVISLFSRKQLEYLSSYERPWQCDTNTLRSGIILNWPADEITEMVNALLSNCDRQAQ